MKRLYTIILSILLAIPCFGQSILKDGIKIVPPSGQTLIAFSQSGKYGFIHNDSSAEIVIPAIFDDVYVEDYRLSDGMILVQKDGKWGAINSDRNSEIWSKQPLVKCIYDSMTPYRNGRSKVTKNNETFYIDTRGNRI